MTSLSQYPRIPATADLSAGSTARIKLLSRLLSGDLEFADQQACMDYPGMQELHDERLVIVQATIEGKITVTLSDRGHTYCERNSIRANAKPIHARSRDAHDINPDALRLF